MADLDPPDSDSSDAASRRKARRVQDRPAGARTFTFVTSQDDSRARSHAMRESWRKRKEQKQLQQQQSRPAPSSRRLVPKPSPAAKHDEEGSRISDPGTVSTSFDGQSQALTPMQWSEGSVSYADEHRQHPPGIAAQALTGMNHALAAVSLDPFDTFPVKLTARHHELLHHWLSTHAAMMFEQSPTTDFNPMRDVWFPLDLSNAASFNGMLAHSAAHLAYLRGEKHSMEVLKYKAEAVSLVNRWLQNEETALSDHTFAAVVRLLTFERYWGTEDLWKVHRSGLERMIQARGGMAALQGNWRLGLVLQLISLMAKPSWFYPSNNICEIADSLPYISSGATTGPTMDLRKLRSLWLISFIQDMRSLMGGSCRLHSEGLRRYPALYEAVSFLRTSFRQSQHTYTETFRTSPSEYDRIVCLFYIGVMLQESTSSSFRDVVASTSAPSWPVLPEKDDLAVLDSALDEARDFWAGSVRNLRSFLLEHFMSQSDNASRANYVVHMTEVLTSLSSEARIGVEKCLLNMFSGKFEKKDIYNVDNNVDEEEYWTVDSLLSSIHGG
ncbi:hypothetical protein VTN77DRAFT_5161 [Rasamsonia byssochlamydoides]|uniref:uncharacterized protein n=1 Tax=Rasamsonia byssochlamydoides TaxID=89139 RepID=UPI0037428924